MTADELLAAAPRLPKVDVVFHLAAYGVRPEQQHPGEMFAVNVGATVALVDLARQIAARALVYSGSCFEYTINTGTPLLREDAPLTTEALYGASKAAAGMFASAAAKTAGPPFVWLRLFGAYGPGEASYRLIPSLVRKLLANERVDLTQGEQVRDFIYIDDVVTGLIASVGAADRHATGPFNLCTGQPVSVRTLAQMVAEELGKPATLLNFGGIPYRRNEAMRLVGDNGCFRTATEWRPMVSLREGVRRTIAELIRGEAAHGNF